MSSTSNNLKLVNQKWASYLEGIKQLSLPQIRYDDIIRAIVNEKSDYGSKMYLESYLRQLFYSRDDVEAIYLYLIHQQKYYVISKESYNTYVRTGTNSTIPDESWYKEAMQSIGNDAYQSLLDEGTDGGYNVNRERAFMGYHRVIRSIASREPRAVISFYMKSAHKDQIMKDISLEQGEHAILLDPNGAAYHTDDVSFYNIMLKNQRLDEVNLPVNDSSTTTMIDNKRYLVVSQQEEHNGWRLVKPIPYSNIYKPAVLTRNWSFIIGGIFLFISVILVTLIANAVTKPLKKLSAQMGRFSEGGFDIVAEVKGKDEVAYLTKQFNQMVERTNDLINERYKMKLVEKNAILKALEAEINPHFLYNALQAISTRALKSQEYEVADMIDALAVTLRYCISGKDTVLAHEELRHMERYFVLQQARFGSRLQVELDWPEDMKDISIPKLSLQTLIENSIKHGLEKMTEDITIIISAKRSDSEAIISVTDNGPGMSEETLTAIQNLLQREWDGQEGEQIGLKNLHTRLKLLYGEQADLLIHRTQQETKFTMVIPWEA